jgi:hypothetical protein
MPKVAEWPKGLKAFVFHGLEVDWEPGREQATADCPFCGKEGKFSINATSSEWHCWSCTLKGNNYGFIRQLWEISDKLTEDYEELAAHRRLLFPETLMHWGVCRSIINRGWLVPGFSPDGKLNQLYRYIGKTLVPTPDMSHQLFYPKTFDKTKRLVYTAEGPWDGMALWEILRCSKFDTEDSLGTLTPTANEGSSLLAAASVIAVPGCNVFHERWADLLEGKIIALMYDSDHPRPKGSIVVPPAGWEGMKRVTGILCRAESPPSEIHCLSWGEKGYNPDLPTGHDVRDHLSVGTTLKERVKLLEDLRRLIQPVPPEWIAGKSSDSRKGEPEIALLPCNDWKTLITAWRKAMKWTTGLDRALSFMLSIIVSTKAMGDQLWGKVIGPPSCGKSVLCEAISVHRKYVTAKSTIRGFHSGYKTDRDGDEDNSLIPLIKGKTLVTKDGDTLLQSPNLAQTLSEARDLYDSTARTHYRNKTGRDYEGVRMTWILCGTEALRSIDSSELGERFLDCVIVEDMEEELEREIGLRVAFRAAMQMSLVSDGTPESQEGPEMTVAKQLTGGYIDYLRLNADRLLCKITYSEEAINYIRALGEFVSFARTRPSRRQDEKVQRELSFRLSSQLVRLAVCTAAVLGEPEINKTVLSRVYSIAMDTARGHTLDILHILFKRGDVGITLKRLSSLTHDPEERRSDYLRFLRKLGVAMAFEPSDPKMGKVTRWKLTPRLTGLYNEVHFNSLMEV